VILQQPASWAVTHGVEPARCGPRQCGGVAVGGPVFDYAPRARQLGLENATGGLSYWPGVVTKKGPPVGADGPISGVPIAWKGKGERSKRGLERVFTQCVRAAYLYVGVGGAFSLGVMGSLHCGITTCLASA
jgi:hypothetical protein